MTRLLVTGAKGAIGRTIVRQAKARGDCVIGIGNGDWSGDPDLPPIDFWINGAVSADNLSLLTQNVGVPDVIIHLAGGATVGPSVNNPSEDFRRTVVSGQALLNWMIDGAPLARLVIASSAAVYGDGHSAPIKEESAHKPTSPYGAHKAALEVLAQTYAQQYHLNISILRLFSVYGPGLRKQLVWELFQKLLKGEPNLVFGGTGDECRDFIHIEDAAAMFPLVAALAGNNAPVFNGCTGESTRVMDLVAAAVSLSQNASVTFTGVKRRGDPEYLVGDTLAAQHVGVSSQTKLLDGLRDTFDWIKANAASSGNN